jgi:Fe-S-cluster containining protein
MIEKRRSLQLKTAIDEDESPCSNCGACCFSRNVRYVRVSGDDYERLADTADSMTVFFENRCYLRMNDGHCAALSVTEQGQFFCSIYEKRPAICREISPGDPQCQAEVQQKSARATAALHESGFLK